MCKASAFRAITPESPHHSAVAVAIATVIVSAVTVAIATVVAVTVKAFTVKITSFAITVVTVRAIANAIPKFSTIWASCNTPSYAIANRNATIAVPICAFPAEVARVAAVPAVRGTCGCQMHVIWASDGHRMDVRLVSDAVRGT